MTDVLHEEFIAFVLPISGDDHIVEYVFGTGIGIKFFSCKFGLLVLIDVLGDLNFGFIVDE